jgi:hypothetical protein
MEWLHLRTDCFRCRHTTFAGTKDGLLSRILSNVPFKCIVSRMRALQGGVPLDIWYRDLDMEDWKGQPHMISMEQPQTNMFCMSCPCYAESCLMSETSDTPHGYE